MFEAAIRAKCEDVCHGQGLIISIYIYTIKQVKKKQYEKGYRIVGLAKIPEFDDAFFSIGSHSIRVERIDGRAINCFGSKLERCCI